VRLTLDRVATDYHESRPCECGQGAAPSIPDLEGFVRDDVQDGAAMKVLIVDDDSIVRLILRRILRHHFAATTVEAANGVEALLELDASRFDLVVLDLHMPVMDGLTVLRAIRAKHTLAALPVVVLTADSHEAHVHDFIRLGVSDYLTKPLVGRQIVERFTYILSHLRLTPAAADTSVAI
jgi:CheY-like chemotaxis protein